jgi:NhaP-type Na+/H+ or K+/H+ antiporter
MLFVFMKCLLSLCFAFLSAVVALLKSVGAGTGLTYVITGEALLNDGTALVLYTLFFELVAKFPDHEITAEFIVVYFVKVIIISPLIGIAMGAVSVILIGLANMRHREDDTTIQLAVTFCCAYFSFYVAQRILLVSGVLACCTAGVILSRYAVPRYLKAETIESVWSALEWIGNTLLFFLAGLIIGKLAVLKVAAIDLLYIVVVYLFLVGIRYVIVLILFPALVYSGNGCNNVATAIFVGWSGLRGAVSIALSLSFYQSTLDGSTKASDSDAESLMFLVGGIAALTLLINATSSKWILQKLHLLEEMDISDAVSVVDPHKREYHNPHTKSTVNRNINRKQKETKIMFEYLKKRIRLKVYNLIETTQQQYLADYLDLSFVFRHCSILKNAPEAAFFPVNGNTEAVMENEEPEPHGEDQKEDFESEMDRFSTASMNGEETEEFKSRKLTQSKIDKLLAGLSTKESVAKEDFQLIDKEVELIEQEEPELKKHHSHARENLQSKIVRQRSSIVRRNSKMNFGEHKHEEHETEDEEEAVRPISAPASRMGVLKRKKSIAYNDFIQTRLRSLSTIQRYGGPEEFESFPRDGENAPIEKPRRNTLVKFQSMDAFPRPEGKAKEASDDEQIGDHKDRKKQKKRSTMTTTTTDSSYGPIVSHDTDGLLSHQESKKEEEDVSTPHPSVVPFSHRFDQQKKQKEKEMEEVQQIIKEEENESFEGFEEDCDEHEAISGGRERGQMTKELANDSESHDASFQSLDLPLELEKTKELIENQEEIDSSPTPSTEKRLSETIDLSPNKLLSFRLLHNIIYYDLLITMRKVFFEVLRVNYFKQINSGQLPSKSFAAILLLNSIDISLNKIRTATDKLDDLHILTESHYYLKKLNEKRLENKRNGYSFHNRSHSHHQHPDNDNSRVSDPVSPTAGIGDKHFIHQLHFRGIDDEDSRQQHTSQHKSHHHDQDEDPYHYYSIHLQTVVMVLMAFIEGHEFAQSRIAFYLGETEGIDTPEEDIVINESKQLVLIAKELLLIIYKPILKYIYSKRILFSIFSLQQTLIEQFVVEGIINMKYSELLFDEIHSDIEHLQSLERKKIFSYYYTKFGEGSAKHVDEEKAERRAQTREQPESSSEKFSLNHVRLVPIFGKYFLEYYFEEFLNSYHFMKERCMKLIR